MAEFIRLSFEKAVNANHISRIEIRSHDPLTVEYFIPCESHLLSGEEAENLIDAVDQLVINRQTVGSEWEAIIDD